MKLQLDKGAISPNAIRAVELLRRQGYAAYVVGGAVRDLALGIVPKDFDIATDATPTQVRKAMRNSRVIGRRFKLVHAYFANEIIEISTFRKLSSDVQTDENGRLIFDNVFGTEEEDAWRRDFTANALFLDPISGEITDYTGGMRDLEKRQLRIIGDPDERYCEDPVRMVRALRLASKLTLQLEEKTADAIRPNLETLAHVPQARLFDELTKVIKSGHSTLCFEQMERLGMIASFFPHYGDVPREGKEWIRAALLMADRRQHQGETVSVSVVIASFYWPLVQDRYREIIGSDKPRIGKVMDLLKGSEIQRSRLFGKRVRLTVCEMWETMARAELARRRKQILSVRRSHSLRVALAFLRLRAEFDESLVPMVMKWDEISECGDDELERTIERLFPDLGQGGGGGGGRRRKRKKKKKE